jgi:hypothetical protein
LRDRATQKNPGTFLGNKKSLGGGLTNPNPQVILVSWLKTASQKTKKIKDKKSLLTKNYNPL